MENEVLKALKIKPSNISKETLRDTPTSNYSGIEGGHTLKDLTKEVRDKSKEERELEFSKLHLK